MRTMKYFPLLLLTAILGAGSACAHITPTVVMAKRADVIKYSLPTATGYFRRTVTLGRDAYAKIRKEGNFSPDISSVRFFYGKNSSGDLVGTVLFDQVNTIHGPIEVGIAFTPAGIVSNVVVTKATVESEPWVNAAVSSGLMNHFVGMSARSDENPLANISPAKIGAMPYFMAQVITTAVSRGLIYYHLLFKPELPQ